MAALPRRAARTGGNEDRRKAVERILGVSVDEQQALMESAHNLSPLQGGRHAEWKKPEIYSLEEVGRRTCGLLRRWIMLYEAELPPAVKR